MANWLVDGAVIAAVVIILCFTVCTLYDNNRVVDAAGTTEYESYKPGVEGASFGELQAQNSDVLGWLEVYGTGIDYPLVQGDDNDEYINHNAEGQFALSGALFVDYRNARDFSDVSTIVFGHHMEDSLMFGDLDRYDDREYLEQHRYGNLYYEGKDHGIEVLGYLLADAYDSTVYSTTVGKNPSRDEFVSYLKSHAKVWVQDPGKGDHLVVLSTCGQGTNDRHIVVARICDKTFESTYTDVSVNRTLADTIEGLSWVLYLAIGLGVFLLIAWIVGGKRATEEDKDQKGQQQP